MEIIQFLMDLLLNLDDFLTTFIANYGFLVYALLFAIIFTETGLFFPFLPGDSLIFAACTFAATGDLNIWIIIVVCLTAGFLGGTLNYIIGDKLGDNLYRRKKQGRFINKKNIDSAMKFYDKHGGTAIILSRFIPIIRTFTPFVAGIAKMGYKRLIIVNTVGVVAWVSICSAAGYFFGNIPFIREHFEAVVLGIILISVIPFFAGIIIAKLKKRKGV